MVKKDKRGTKVMALVPAYDCGLADGPFFLKGDAATWRKQILRMIIQLKLSLLSRQPLS